VTIGASPINLGSRVNPTAYHHHHPSNSALTTSFMREAGVPAYTSAGPYPLPTAADDRYGGALHSLGRQPSMDGGLPTIDTTSYSSHPGSAYGSPRDDESATRFGLGLSPVAATKGLSALDAPMPASFDSNGISHAARYGPWPASVPSKFGLDSPSPSLNNAKDSRTSETLKLLHTSAFGSSDHLLSSSAASGVDPHDSMMGSSPPTAGQTEGEYFGRRAAAMHSASRYYAKPRLMSSSAPKVDRDWEENFLFFEEDYVPGALANEVLTPAEKARRGSLRVTDGETHPSPSAGTADPPGSGPASVMTTPMKYGSPIGAASPSRFGPLFQRHRAEEELDAGGGSLGKSLKGASAFGHVGSPLRNSSLAGGIDVNGSGGRPSLSGGAGSRSGSLGADSLSVLTQQLQRTRMSGAGLPGDDGSGGSSPRPHHHHHPGAVSRPSVGVIGGGNSRQESRESGKTLERHVSSGSIGSSVANGRFTTPIDEEDPAFVFSMEEEDEAAQAQLRAARKRASGGGSGGWSYAAAASAGKTNGAAGSGSVATSAAVETR